MPFYGRLRKMAKVIKRDEAPESGQHDTTVSVMQTGSRNVISGHTYDARAEALNIRQDAKQEADDIIAQAQQEAERLVAEAQQQADSIREQAQAEGLELGRQNGASEAVQVVAESVQRAREFEEQLLPQLKDLSVAIAKKILGRELEFHPEAIVDIVRQALAEKARQRTEIFMRVHPDDIALIRDNKPALLEVLSRAKDIAIREDSEIERHGVVIETDAGRIDAQLSTQLAVFEQVLKTAG